MARSFTEEEAKELQEKNKRAIENKKRAYKRAGKKPFEVLSSGVIPQDVFDANFREPLDTEFVEGGGQNV